MDLRKKHFRMQLNILTGRPRKSGRFLTWDVVVKPCFYRKVALLLKVDKIKNKNEEKKIPRRIV